MANPNVKIEQLWASWGIIKVGHAEYSTRCVVARKEYYEGYEVLNKFFLFVIFLEGC
jgi:hypothetical protein